MSAAAAIRHRQVRRRIERLAWLARVPVLRAQLAQMRGRAW